MNQVDFKMNREKLFEALQLKKGVTCLLRAQPLSVLNYDVVQGLYVAVKPTYTNNDCMMSIGWKRQGSPSKVSELDCYKKASVYADLSTSNHLSMSHDFLQAQLRKIIPLEVFRYCKGVIIERDKIDYANKVNFNDSRSSFVPVRVRLMFKKEDAGMIRAIRDTSKHAA
tara:strand:+ start:1467 stop:1973 length:507 start_codon:yes stop_codon:yes gene_type:complete